ncbi:MAG: 4-alpha-glucanotransferase [Ardenticatenales bacterium]|nr:4-alpha-glucanotransferase [Ardenticatenales bacterium]
MKFPRQSGILLHPTSLPGPHGIGELGDAAYRFVDWLVSAGQSIWQLLPLGPTGYADSPYQSLSAFAGNPMLISLDKLADDGLLSRAALADGPSFPSQRVDYGAVIRWKGTLLRKAFLAWKSATSRDARYDAWCDENEHWLDDYALFVALKHHFGGGSWVHWPEPLRRHITGTLDMYREELANEIAFQRFAQYEFFVQWKALHEYAAKQGIALIGDMPIFVAHDSADTWASQQAFTLKGDGTLSAQAGVPPDYFSETGQLWGNPLYQWELMAADGYAWWIERFRTLLTLVDRVRLDHFRGFEAYWSVPGDATTAVDGAWEPGPGAALFTAICDALGTLPIIAENLGVITEEVEALRTEFDYPGMRILQFGFTADESPDFLPHRYEANTVAYTGTHDNETTAGWFEGLDSATRERVLDYFDSSPAQIVRAMIRSLIASVADTVIFPMQDVLDLGNEARMNHPGTTGNNWQWRATEAQFTEEAASWLAHLCRLYER